MQFLSNKENEESSEDYVDRETAVARQHVQDAETVVMNEQESMRNTEKVGSTTRKPENTFQEMLNAIGQSLSNLARSNDEQDVEVETDDEEDTERGKLSKDDERGGVMGTISRMVQQQMESFRRNQMRIDKLTQPGWWDAADYFLARDNKYGGAELIVPAVVKRHRDTTAATRSSKTFGEQMQTLDIVPGKWQMPKGTSCPRSCWMRLCSEELQSYQGIVTLAPNPVGHSSPVKNSKPIDPVRFERCI